MIASMEQIVKIMETWAPKQLAEEWDNVGWMVGNTKRTVNKVMIALEINGDVVEEAIDKSVDMIITHHPLIFKGLKSISDRDALGKWILALIKNNISVYSAHTNLDAAYGGINDYLCGLFGLERTMSLGSVSDRQVDRLNGQVDRQIETDPEGLGRVAWLPLPLDASSFLQNVKDILGLESIRFSGNGKEMISKVAVCSGAGADMMKDAHLAGCDVYLTGDIKYHEYRSAQEIGLAVADMTHFASENIYMGYLAERLQMACDDKDYEVRIVASEVLTQPYSEI